MAILIEMTNASQLTEWNGATDVVMKADLDIEDASSFPININADNITFDGNNYVINIANTVENFTGLFDISSSNVIIKNLMVKINNISDTAVYEAGIFTGAIICSIFNSCIITNCAAVGPPSNNYVFYGSQRCGGIVGRISIENVIPRTVEISNCYSTISAHSNSNSVGGIVGSAEGIGPHVFTISNCFNNGSILGTDCSQCGGIISRMYVSDSITLNINNCYASGDFTAYSAVYSGAIYGCGTNMPSVDTTLNINNCYAIRSTDFQPVKLIGVTYDIALNVTNSYGSDYGSSITDVLTGTSGVWNTVILPYRLTPFLDTPWNYTTYTSYDITNTYVSFGFTSGGAGDPHITTLNGDIYDLDLTGYIRYFDNCNKDRLIINGFISAGDYNYCKLDYIRKIYIKYKDNELEIDMGFRGCPVSIIKNTGFELKKYNLPMKKYIWRRCKKCNYTTNNNDESHNGGEHEMQKLVRNCVELTIEVPGDNVYDIKMINVSAGNKHPCQIYVNVRNKSKIFNYFGACVSNAYQNYITLDNLYDINGIMLKNAIVISHM